MNIKEKIDDFNKRWKLIPNTSYDEEFQKFKTRIINIIANIDSEVVDEGIVMFCNLVSKSVEWLSNSQSRWSLNIIKTFKEEKNEVEFYRLIEIIFLLKYSHTNSIIHKFDSFRDNYYNLIKEAIDYSNVNVSIIKKGEDVILFPRGEKLLDERLVDEVITFLNSESSKHFIEALKFYQKTNHIKSAESLRRALEEYLRFKLNNAKGLDANISELQTKLKTDGRDPMIRNIIFQTFNYLDKYFNENSKHNDGEIDEAENEYLIYQVGLLLRFIHKV